jgi:hypothetical protein
VTLNLNGTGESFSAKWIDVEAHRAIRVEPLHGRGRLVTVPFPCATLLHLKTRP